MGIVKKIIFGLILAVFEISMFNISLELGISSLILISAIFCICLVLKKITTVIHNDLVLNSESFQDSEKIELRNSLGLGEKKSESKNIIPGIDKSLFENFKKNLKLNISSDSFEDNTFPKANLKNSDLLKKTYEKPIPENEQTTFSEDLEEKEHVRVTLSKNAKNKIADKKDFVEENNGGLDKEISEISNIQKTTPFKKLGAGEEALEILSKKHQTLMQQSDYSQFGELVDYEDDLFADEFIPIPGDEKLSKLENQIKINENLSETEKEYYTSKDENNSENSLINDATYNEKVSEAEALLGLATKTCSAGKIEEAQASLKIYLDLLNDLNQQASPDVIQLAEKLGIPLQQFKSDTKTENITEIKKEPKIQGQNILQDFPEQTNYANVMDGLVKSLEEEEEYEEALPLLKDLLNYNRKRVNISEVDPLYDRIEQAYSSLKNDEGLVKTYKEHLEIKKQLNDIEGEINLLDLISYYYANIGDQEASNRYQEESKRKKVILDQEIAKEE